MPRDFEICMENGGKVRTKKVGKKMAKVCIDKMGKTHMGEMMPEKKK